AHAGRPGAGLARPAGPRRNRAAAASPQGSAQSLGLHLAPGSGLRWTSGRWRLRTIGAGFSFDLARRPPYISAMTDRSRATAEAMSINEIVENFSLLEEWDD